MAKSWVINRARVAMRAVTLLGIALSAAQPVAAEDSPLVGFFRFFAPTDVRADTTDQLACAFGFFRQDADGKGHDYLLDQAAYAKTGKISYRIGTTFTCKYNAADQSEVCEITSPLESLNSGTVHFLYYDITPDSVGFQSFSSPSDLQAAVTARTPGNVPADLQHFVRCDGWSEAALAPFIDATAVNPADQDLPKNLEDPFAGDQAQANLKQAEQIQKAILGQ